MMGASVFRSLPFRGSGLRVKKGAQDVEPCAVYTANAFAKLQSSKKWVRLDDQPHFSESASSGRDP